MFDDRRSDGNPGILASCVIAGIINNTYPKKHQYSCGHDDHKSFFIQPSKFSSSVGRIMYWFHYRCVANISGIKQWIQPSATHPFRSWGSIITSALLHKLGMGLRTRCIIPTVRRSLCSSPRMGVGLLPWLLVEYSKSVREHSIVLCRLSEGG